MYLIKHIAMMMIIIIMEYNSVLNSSACQRLKPCNRQSTYKWIQLITNYKLQQAQENPKRRTKRNTFRNRALVSTKYYLYR